MDSKKVLLTLRIIAIILLVINSLNALAAGYSFISDPSGKGLGMDTDYLRYSPFNNFLIPGIVLFIVNGVLSAVIATLTIMKKKYFEMLISLQGVLLGGWIVVQLIMVRFFHAPAFNNVGNSGCFSEDRSSAKVRNEGRSLEIMAFQILKSLGFGF